MTRISGLKATYYERLKSRLVQLEAHVGTNIIARGA